MDLNSHGLQPVEPNNHFKWGISQTNHDLNSHGLQPVEPNNHFKGLSQTNQDLKPKKNL
jgi:hypothetical protein